MRGAGMQSPVNSSSSPAAASAADASDRGGADGGRCGADSVSAVVDV